tara:strand:- start:770 stop:1018 length:249 start_codon:yes stop_codon:yes gene_type:complete
VWPLALCLIGHCHYHKQLHRDDGAIEQIGPEIFLKHSTNPFARIFARPSDSNSICALSKGGNGAACLQPNLPEKEERKEIIL